MIRPVHFEADLIMVCNSLDAGGIERVVSTLANAWVRRGRRMCVITLHDRRRFYALDPAVHHVIVDKAGLTWIAELVKALKRRLLALTKTRVWLAAILGGPLYHFFSEYLYQINFRLFAAYEAWALRRALRNVASPIVVAFGTSINVITIKACRGLQRRVIICERSNPGRLLHQKWDRLSRQVYREADLVTVNTRSGLDSMRPFVEPRKLAFVPNPLALPNGDGRADGQTSPPILLTVGRLVWEKAHDVLLEAFAGAGPELKEWRLAVVGDGQLAGVLRAHAQALGVASRVDWHGVVADPHAFYRAATIFVLPSRMEGMPNVLLEAMSCGLPVIVSDGTPGPLELVEDEVTGLVFPVNQPAALARILIRLANDAELRRRLGEAGRARVSEHELPRAITRWEVIVGLPSIGTADRSASSESPGRVVSAQ